jgi:hypothetical protein
VIHRWGPRKRSCDSMTDNSSWARFKPARPLSGIVAALVVDSALRRCDPVSCALQIGDGVLARLWPHAFFPRSLRLLSGDDTSLDLVSSRHLITPADPSLFSSYSSWLGWLRAVEGPKRSRLRTTKKRGSLC